MERCRAVSPGVIAGEVIGPSGKPIAGASVMIVQGPQHEDIALLTDANGKFILGARVGGTYRLLVKASGFPGVEQDVEVTGRTTTSVRIKLGGN